MSTKDLVKPINRAHSNITTFHAVQVLLEGGTVYGDQVGAGRTANATKAKIIALCKAEAKRQLVAMDKAQAALDRKVTSQLQKAQKP